MKKAISKWLVCVRETGDIIEECNTEKEAENKLADFEMEDLSDGYYDENFYEITEKEN